MRITPRNGQPFLAISGLSKAEVWALEEEEREKEKEKRAEDDRMERFCRGEDVDGDDEEVVKKKQKGGKKKQAPLTHDAPSSGKGKNKKETTSRFIPSPLDSDDDVEDDSAELNHRRSQLGKGPKIDHNHGKDRQKQNDGWTPTFL
jgi:hypothetical protein